MLLLEKVELVAVVVVLETVLIQIIMVAFLVGVV
jgi:hypothetical protein